MWVFVAIAVVTVLVLWLRWNFNHWKNKGIPYVEPETLFGNMRSTIIGSKGFAILSEEIYNAFPGAPAVGFFRLRQPVLQAKDLELVKAILVTEFSSFRENGMEISKEADPILGRNPFFVGADEWKEVRRAHTHSHTTSKLRQLFEYVEEVKEDLVAFINENLNKKFEAIDFCTKYTTDVVSSCVFGIKTSSFQGGSSEFSKYSKKLVEINWRFMVFMFVPSIFNRFRIPIVRRECTDYFYNLVKELATMREKEKLFRTDFLQNMISDKTEDWSYMDMTSKAMSFFIDGYVTSATEMGFFLYMLALHPEAQQRLREEVVKADKLDFETVHQLPFLDSVFNETLRLYPAGVVLQKVCTQDVTITTSKGAFDFKRGDSIEIPVYAIHRDPENFPEPLKFIPDRFLETPNHPALLTFGAGPRACFGNKFAKTQIKTGLAYMVKHFKIIPGTEDRDIPTINNRNALLISPDKEMSVVFQKL